MGTLAGAWKASSRRTLAEWALVSLLALALAAALLISGVSGRLDNILYDAALRLTPRPADARVLIVTIDDRAIAEVGAWPWPRDVHARLIDRLTEAGVRAVGYDVLFVDPGPNPAADAALADAMTRSGRVCLPVLIDTPGPNGDAFRIVPPRPGFARAAGGLGHVGVAYDPDGVSRRADLAMRAGGGRLDHLMRCVETLGVGQRPATGLPRPDGGQALSRAETVLIPFGGGPGRVRTVSAASVLRGEIPQAFLKDRYVLVGATAAGLHDRHSTPFSTHNAAMSGVELQANLLEGLLQGRMIRPAPLWAALPLTLGLVAAFLAFLPVLAPRANLAMGFGVLVVALAVSVAGLAFGRIWFPPSPALLTVLAAFPLWGWRRLEAANSYMVEELQRFAGEPDILGAGVETEGGGDVVAQHIGLMRQTVQRARTLREYAAAAAVQREQTIQFLTHDIRSPQSSILAVLESGDAAAPDASARIAAYARRTLTLADNFAHMAKAESGALTQEVLNMPDLVSEAMDDMWPLASRAGVRLAFGEDGEEQLVRGDRSLLSRAIGNLLDNAIKYSPAGEVVTASVEVADTASGEIVRLRIVDQGEGLTPDQQTGLFQKFARAGGQNASGIGLGLALVDEVARRHGGTVSCVSPPGEGATFVLDLPRVTEA